MWFVYINLRGKIVPSYYWNRPSMFFIDLLNSNNVCLLHKLRSFIIYYFKIRSDTLYIRPLTYFVYLDCSLYVCYYVLLLLLLYVLFLPTAICVCKYFKLPNRSMNFWYLYLICMSQVAYID